MDVKPSPPPELPNCTEFTVNETSDPLSTLSDILRWASRCPRLQHLVIVGALLREPGAGVQELQLPVTLTSLTLQRYELSHGQDRASFWRQFSPRVKTLTLSAVSPHRMVMSTLFPVDFTESRWELQCLTLEGLGFHPEVFELVSRAFPHVKVLKWTLKAYPRNATFPQLHKLSLAIQGDSVLGSFLASLEGSDLPSLKTLEIRRLPEDHVEATKAMQKVRLGQRCAALGVNVDVADEERPELPGDGHETPPERARW